MDTQRTKEMTLIHRQTDRQTPEGLRVDVGQLWVAAELQFGDFWKVLESSSLHHQQLLHVVQTETQTESDVSSSFHSQELFERTFPAVLN